MKTPLWGALSNTGESPSARTLRAISMDGYCWRKSWELPYEGGLSLMWKLGIANNMVPRSIRRIFQCSLLTSDAQNFHGRSFLLTSWASDRKGASQYFKALIDRASFNELSLGLLKSIASDHTIRYCPSCMDHRYHSVYFQIEGLKFCPIHNELLRDDCRHCGGKTGRYSWAAETMSSPFACSHCHRPLGHGKPAVTPSDFNIPLDCSAMSSIASFIALLKNCQINWPSYGSWRYGADPTIRDDAQKRAGSFSIYRQIVPNTLSEAHLTHTPVYIYDAGEGKIEDQFDIEDKYSNRERIFFRMKRYIGRLISTRHGGTCSERTLNALRVHFDLMYPDLPVCSLWFAFYLWEYHFIEQYSHPQPFHDNENQSIHLRPVIRTWPCEVHINDKAWRIFCIWTFLSFVEIAHAWDRFVEEDGQGEITHESLLNALGQLRLDIVPELQAFPNNISFLQVSLPNTVKPSCFLVSGNTSTSFNSLLKGDLYAGCSS